MLGGMGCLNLGLDWPHHPQDARQELVWQLAGDIHRQVISDKQHSRLPPMSYYACELLRPALRERYEQLHKLPPLQL